MGDISKHYSTHEFRCKCADCQAAQVKPVINMTLVVSLELIHSYFAVLLNTKIKVDIISGNRCHAHNSSKEVGGKPDSRHLVPEHGDGADIVVSALNEHGHWEPIDPQLVYDLINDTFTKSFGCHAYVDKGFTHLDARPHRARW